MTAEELRNRLEWLELSQMAFARLIGSNPRTVRHWVAGTRSIPIMVERFTDLVEKLQAAERRK